MSGVKAVSHRVKIDDRIATSKGEINIATGQIDKDAIVQKDVGDIEETEVTYEADPNSVDPKDADKNAVDKGSDEKNERSALAENPSAKSSASSI